MNAKSFLGITIALSALLCLGGGIGSDFDNSARSSSPLASGGAPGDASVAAGVGEFSVEQPALREPSRSDVGGAECVADQGAPYLATSC